MPQTAELGAGGEDSLLPGRAGSGVGRRSVTGVEPWSEMFNDVLHIRERSGACGGRKDSIIIAA